MATPPASICIFAPTPLLTVTIEATVDDRDDLHLHPGGQGFWVARMVQSLGITPSLCVPVGGETGNVLRRLLMDIAIEVNAVDVTGPSGSYIHDRRGGERRELFRSEITQLGRHELDELYTATLGAGIAAGVCVLTGTQEQRVLDPDTYRRLAKDLTANDVRVVADLSGDLLGAALEGGVHMLKISSDELVRDGWATDDASEAIVEGVKKLRGEGAEDVVVTRAEHDSIACVDQRWFRIRTPAMDVVEHRGAGDSVTAGLAVALRAGLDAEASLRLSAAAGALNVTRHGLGSGRADAIRQLASNVEIRAMELP
jgi:1-phosphofructokinase